MVRYSVRSSMCPVIVSRGWCRAALACSTHRAPHHASRRSLSYHLLDGRNALQHLHPRIHAEREHPFLDGAVADFGRARIHDDPPANLLTHRHHFVDALAALETRSATGVTPGAFEEAELRSEEHTSELQSPYVISY